MPIIDLNQLPAPDVVEELDFETILAERKATLISLYPEEELLWWCLRAVVSQVDLLMERFVDLNRRLMKLETSE
ncbi:hypothetical protein EBP75_20850 [Escherichia coli O7]|nr:hypothetical protein [Escherichia coli O7]